MTRGNYALSRLIVLLYIHCPYDVYVQVCVWHTIH